MTGDFKSPLHQTVTTTATEFWNDSCSTRELEYAISHGASGATTNPTIVLEVLNQEMATWKPRILDLLRKNPRWSEASVSWKLMEMMAAEGARLLEPVWEHSGHRKGRLSIQTNPILYRDAQALLEQAVQLDRIAPNMQVKIPVTAAGLEAMEKATFAGVNINATVCFTVPQALAVGEAVQRALVRRREQGKPVSTMSPVCTIMVGRMDDWLKVLARKHGILVEPGHMDWAGIACIKKAHAIYEARGYRTRLLAAAYRHHLHWSQLVGGDIILTIPYHWQRLFNASSIPVVPRFHEPVDPRIISELSDAFPDFQNAYAEDGLSVSRFDTFGATVRTLRGFIASLYQLQGTVRDIMLPNPDLP